MKTSLGTELALAYNLNALREIRDWANNAAQILENRAMDETPMADYIADSGTFNRLSEALGKIIAA